jgi:photoactive yellow protein
MSDRHSEPGSAAMPAATGVLDTPINLATPDLFDRLETATASELDALSFGVVAMAPDGTVEHYNIAEGRLSGLTPARVIGRNFFTAVAACTDNFMVAHRYAVEPDIDAVIDYVFTFRLAPMNVRLRLLKRADRRHMYLVVEPRG